MTSQRHRFVEISLTSVALLGLLNAVPAGAADSHCKGLAQAQCGTTAGCGWVDTYTRKDGRSVEGYCKKATLPPGAGRDKGATETPVPTATGKTPGGEKIRAVPPAAAPAETAAPKPTTRPAPARAPAPAPTPTPAQPQ